jgi:diguanylate cyclase (GGDEF)-like protein
LSRTFGSSESQSATRFVEGIPSKEETWMKANSYISEPSLSLFGRDDLKVWQSSLLMQGQAAALVARTSSIVPSATDSLPQTLERFGIVTWEANPFTMQFLSVSENAEELLGFRKEDWLRYADFWAQHVDSRDQLRAITNRQNAVLMGSQTRFLYRMIGRDGNIVEVQESCIATIGSNGDLVLRGCFVSGDFGLEKNEDHDYMGMFRSLMSEIPGLMWMCDHRLNVNWSLGSDFSVLKVRSEHPRNANLFDLFPDQDKLRVHVAMHLRAVNGEFLTYEVEVAGRTHQVILKPYFSDSMHPEGCLGLAMDITERKWAEERIFRMAVTDPLTGLANYRTFRRVLDREMRRSERTKRPLTLLLFDMDGLKAINDAHGHLVGSRSLCRLAKALQSNCRAVDVSARFGGDEFAVILPDTDLSEAHQVARRISDFLQREEEQPQISASFGGAVYPSEGSTAEQLIAAADRALYQQKNLRQTARGREGRN